MGFAVKDARLFEDSVSYKNTKNLLIPAIFFNLPRFYK